MRITRNMLKNYASETNGKYDLSLSVEFFNGMHIFIILDIQYTS